MTSSKASSKAASTEAASRKAASTEAASRKAATALKELKARLSRPLGRVFYAEGEAVEALNKIKETKGAFVASVGDLATFTLLVNGVTPDLALYDFKVKRASAPMEVIREINALKATEVVVRSPRGIVSRELERAVERACAAPALKTKIRVIGEDDLATLAVLAHAPRNAIVIYGQPAVVFVEGTARNKKMATQSISQLRSHRGHRGHGGGRGTR